MSISYHYGFRECDKNVFRAHYELHPKVMQSWIEATNLCYTRWWLLSSSSFGGNIMEIRFSLTREDFWHYIIYAYTQQRRRALWSLLIVYAFLVLFAVLSVSFSIFSSFSFVNLVPALILLVLFPLLIWYRMRRTAAQGAGWGGEHSISITPEGIREKTDQGEGTRNWSAIKTIGQDKYSLYLVVNASSRSLVLATIIPRRAFATLQDAEMFLSQARQYWMSGQQVRSQ